MTKQYYNEVLNKQEKSKVIQPFYGKYMNLEPCMFVVVGVFNINFVLSRM